MRRRIRIAGSILLLLAGAVFLALRESEPTYQGRRISLILDDWAAGADGESQEAALRAVGTNALPYVVRKLMRNDSAWRRRLHDTWRKLPNSLQNILPEPKRDLDVLNGGSAFLYVGPGAIPHAIALLKHKSPSVRMAAAAGLYSLRWKFTGATLAIPALTDALRDPEPEVRAYAARALAEMGADASSAVPALASIAADPGIGLPASHSIILRGTAVFALGRLGPAAKDAIPTLKSMLQAQSTGSSLRGKVAFAIWQIDGDVDTALPVFLQEMPLTSELEKRDWIIALGGMGPRARAAIPQLEKELSQDKQSRVLESVTNALLKIDPEAVAKLGVFPAAK